MLERSALQENRVEWRPSGKTSAQRRQGGLKNQERLNVLTARFRNALKKSVEGIIEAGRVLIEAKNELEHGQFADWVVNDLRFGSRKDGSRSADLRKAEMLMFLARNEVISKSCHWHDISAVAPYALGVDADTPQAAAARTDRKWGSQLRYDP